MSATGTDILLLGVSHRTAPIAMRERLCLESSDVAALHIVLRSIPGVRECLMLATCNRLEACLVHDAGADVSPGVATALAQAAGFPADDLAAALASLRGEDAVRHLFEVASGLDSQLLGETEIQGQVRAAYERAQMLGTIGPRLHRVLQKTLQASKWIRANTAIGRGQVSIGNVAVELAERIYGNLSSCRVLVLGSGEVGELTAAALGSRGAKAITVCNRTEANAHALAIKVGAGVIPYGQHLPALADFDIVVGCTASPEFQVTRTHAAAALTRRPNLPMFFIDLAMPRDIAPDVAALPNAFRYDFDDLSAIADGNLRARESDLAYCREVLAFRAAALWERLATMR